LSYDEQETLLDSEGEMRELNMI